MISDEFLNFIEERHSIYLRRASGFPAPWTKDPMLREYKFTNIYRELDRTTIWCKNNVRDRYTSDFDIAMAVFVFRFFNRIETAKYIFPGPFDHYLRTGDLKPIREAVYDNRQKMGLPVATGAYIIKTVNGLPKLDGILWAIKEGMPVISGMVKRHNRMLARAHYLLLEAPYLGNFMAAQIVADLKYTKVLKDAYDWHTWAASGPGSRRGLNLLIMKDIHHRLSEKDWLEKLLIMRRLLLLPFFKERDWEEPHAQDVQNMLCEFSKYKRGFSKNKFVPFPYEYH